MNTNEEFAKAIIDPLYAENEPLRDLLWTHSRAVADLALRCARQRSLDVDTDFVEQAALLHDIGIIRTDAPSIFCFGTEPYIRHGIIGGEMLRELDLPRHARVCETHTGAGLSVDDIISEHLPLPHVDLLPVTLEEKLICYADKFFSKSGDPRRQKSLEKVRASMARHGADSLARFDALHRLFAIPETSV